MIKALLGLVGGVALAWALATCAAAWIWPTAPTFLWSTTAAGLCLAPAALTLAWTRRASRGAPEQRLLAAFGGMGVRLAVVLAAGLILFLNVEAFAYQRFWIFVVLYYLLTLGLETALLVRGAEAGRGS